jgi:hypothetical protein
MTFLLNTNNKQKHFGESFSVKIPNGFEVNIDLHGEFNPEELQILNLSTTSLPNPIFRVIDKGAGFYTVKIFFQKDVYHIGSSHEFIFYDKVETEVGKSDFLKNLSDAKSMAAIQAKKAGALTRRVLKTLFYMLLSTAVFSAVLFLDSKYKEKTGGILNKAWNYISVNAWIDKAEEVEEKIIKKEHPVYSYDDFKELQEELGEDGFGFDLRSNFSHAGKDLFAMNNLHRKITTNNNGEVIKSLEPTYLTREEAQEVCGKYNSRLPTRKEADFILASKFSGITDKFYKIKTETEYPEWVSGDYDDFLDVYMKVKSTLPLRFEMINGVKVVGDEETLSPFRCVFEAKDFE